MRVIEPSQLNVKAEQSEESRPKRKKSKYRTFVFLAIVLIALGYFASNKLDFNVKTSNNTNESKKAEAISVTPPTGEIRTFSGQEFKGIYESMSYPNTIAIVNPPEITGNHDADEKIRQLAEERGYHMTSIPLQSIIKINEPRLMNDDLLQPLAAKGWETLKAAAKTDNIPLSLNAAYRSVDYQRNLFLERLYGNGTTALQIAQGAGDRAVNVTLGLTAVPGYSRHHTGYTVDLWCEDGSTVFKYSSCYEWISDNNYQKAKENGWIPSYPEGADQQGPEPEPWEYVWVGIDRLR